VDGRWLSAGSRIVFCFALVDGPQWISEASVLTASLPLTSSVCVVAPLVVFDVSSLVTRLLVVLLMT
jgi:hypothetical protein